MAPVVAGIALVGAGVSAYGEYRKGKDAEKAAEYNAELEERRGRERARAMRARGRSIKATQRANIGASGVQLEGTPLEVLAETAAMAELDAASTMADARATARLDRMQGESAVKQGKMRAAATLLSGTAGAASAYGSLRRA